jgi:hypothetical protein
LLKIPASICSISVEGMRLPVSTMLKYDTDGAAPAST